MFYLLTYTLFLSLMAFSNRLGKKLSLVLTFYLIFFASVRWGVGTDFFTYMEIYEFAPNILSFSIFLDSYSNIEFGYKLLVSLSKTVESEIFYLFANSFFSILILYLGLLRIEREVKFNLVLSLFIYFTIFYISYTFNVMRQAIAMALFVYSLKDIYRHKLWRVLIIASLAATLHASGWLIFLAYVWYRFVLMFKFKGATFYVVLAILTLLLHQLDIGVLLLNYVFPDKYLKFQVMWGEVELTSLVYRYILFALLLSFYIQYPKVKYGELFLSLYSLGLVFYVVFSFSDMLAARFNMFFRVIEIIALPVYLYSVRSALNKVLYFLLILCLVTLPLLQAAKVDENQYKINQKIFSVF